MIENEQAKHCPRCGGIMVKQSDITSGYFPSGAAIGRPESNTIEIWVCTKCGVICYDC